MALRFKCVCGASLSAAEDQPGRKMTCPNCGINVVIPAPPPQRGPAIKISLDDLPRPPPPPSPPEAVPVLEPIPLADDLSPQTMKANRKMEGKVCAVCQAKIRLGEDLRICRHCKLPFHQGCWDENGGCGTYGCEGGKGAKPKLSYADFAVPRDQVAAPDYARPAQDSFPEFRPSAISSLDQGPAAPGVPAHTSGMAVASLVLGLVGWSLCGIGSLLAVIFGHAALSEIKRSRGRVGGRGMAIAGLALGYVELTIGLLLVLRWFAAH